LHEKVVAEVERGRSKTTWATLSKVVTAMGGRLEDLPATKAS